MKTTIASFTALALALLAAGCADTTEDTGATEAHIVDVRQSEIERQSIGNCWIYAYAGWAESMHLRATNEAFDVSQTYWTYWDWFGKIMGGSADQLATGGSFSDTRRLVTRYGLVREEDFVPSEARDARQQKAAMEAINRSLQSGQLASASSRANGAVVRAELDRAFALGPDPIAMLDAAFGRDGSRNAQHAKIVRANQFEVGYAGASVPAGSIEKTTLEVANQTWQQVPYRGDSRGFLTRIQRALHARNPALITWLVDWNAFATSGPKVGSFNLDTLRANGMKPGKQGFHMAVLEDYQARLADGRLVAVGADNALPTGSPVFRELLEPSTQIELLRVKNSWGTAQPSPRRAAGHHDLYLSYLEADWMWCESSGAGSPDRCVDVKPLVDVILPPGF